MLISNRIINKIKKQYKQAVYIDKNGNKNTNISLDADNEAFIIARNSLQLINKLTKDCLHNMSFNISDLRDEYITYLNNIEAGICGDSFTNHNGDKVDIEFHVKQLDSNFEYKIIQQFEQDYENQLKSAPIHDLLDIEEQLGAYIINNFYLGIIMIFINGEYIDSKAKFFKRAQKDQLKTIGLQLIGEYKQQYL